MKILNATLVIP